MGGERGLLTTEEKMKKRIEVTRRGECLSQKEKAETEEEKKALDIAFSRWKLKNKS